MIVHQVAPQVPALSDLDSKQAIINHEIEQGLIKLRDFVESQIGTSVPVEYRVTEKPLLIALPDMLEEGYRDFIFTGLKGTGTMKKLLWGSTTVGIIDRVDNIVVAMPDTTAGHMPESIYVATTPAYPLNRVEFNKVLEVFQNKLKSIGFFSIARDKGEHDKIMRYLEELKSIYGGDYQVTTGIFEGESVLRGIHDILADKKHEVLILQRGSRGVMDELFRKSMVNELVYDGRTPLIILP